MNFISRLFSSTPPAAEPEVRFGRYSDIYKKAERYEAWDKSWWLLEEKKYWEAYHQFFLYLGDDKEKNVNVRKEGNKLFFECFQGSKKIIGEANHGSDNDLSWLSLSCPSPVFSCRPRHEWRQLRIKGEQFVITQRCLARVDMKKVGSWILQNL